MQNNTQNQLKVKINELYIKLFKNNQIYNKIIIKINKSI